MKNKFDLEVSNRINDLKQVIMTIGETFTTPYCVTRRKVKTNFNKTKFKSLANHFKACRDILNQIYKENKIWFNKNYTMLAVTGYINEFEKELNEVYSMLQVK